MSKRTRLIAEYGMLIALAMILGYAESMLPAFFPVPGIKLGLTNVVVLYALWAMDVRSAVFVNLIRIFLSGILFGNGMSIIYSLAGGTLSLLVMIIMKKYAGLRIITVSIAGGVFHNVGQIIAAVIILGSAYVAYYFAALWFAGIVSGAIIGALGGTIVLRLKRQGYEA